MFRYFVSIDTLLYDSTHQFIIVKVKGLLFGVFGNQQVDDENIEEVGN